MTPHLPEAPKGLRSALRTFGIALLITLVPAGIASAAQRPDFLVARQAIAAPSGAGGICARYGWACTRGGGAGLTDAAAMKVARAVNSSVNRTTRPVSDLAQYGVQENWTLPSARGGDCEDLVLMKKKKLIAQGVAPERLLIATVLDRKRGSHAVLVLRTAAGDYVLDSLVGSIKPWRDTGYSFLKMQDPASPSRWNAIFAGGIFAARA